MIGNLSIFVFGRNFNFVVAVRFNMRRQPLEIDVDWNYKNERGIGNAANFWLTIRQVCISRNFSFGFRSTIDTRHNLKQNLRVDPFLWKVFFVGRPTQTPSSLPFFCLNSFGLYSPYPNCWITDKSLTQIFLGFIAPKSSRSNTKVRFKGESDF